MNIIVVEDELKTAKSLMQIITDLQPDACITGQYQSIESSVKALSEGLQPDLIFMDIQLADGLCFEIFKQVKVTSPVVFCTAFDEYSLEAFKRNGVDYILKPFSKDDISEAFRKVHELKNFFQQKQGPDLSELLNRLAPPPSVKTSFLVFKNQQYTTVSIDKIACFYIRFDATCILTLNKEQFTVNQSLDQIAASVSATQFFRVNRQYLVNFDAITGVEHHFMRKLHVKLVVDTPDALLINKEKSAAFLSWMENR